MIDRRDFLSDLARAAAMCAIVPNAWRVTSRPRLADDPFQLGVASGDPTSDGGTLWTRLAPRPLEPEGGMDGQRTVVAWQVADDETFQRIVAQGRATAAPELSYSVHVDVAGLQPDRWYHYRFTIGEAVSPVGRLRTSPAAGSGTSLRLGVVSCQHWEQGLFTAYDHLSRESLDLVAHLGDYIYEYGPITGRVRTHVGLECRTLDDYRRRYALYKSDPMLRTAHQSCPFITVWDDHEVDNNYTGTIGENIMESDEQMRTRRAAAYQAWWEHQPVRVPRARSWADLNITRTIPWGGLARFSMLDTRQYRSDQPCGDGRRIVPCGEWANPDRTMLGAEQEQWLAGSLGRSAVRWEILGNQVMVAPVDEGRGPEQSFAMDRWSGYPAAHDRLLRTIAERAPNRTVVLTGDIHSAWANELRMHFGRPEQASVAAEFVATSISSGGDGSDGTGAAMTATLADNPHIKWHNARRGYLSCTVTPTTWLTEYRTLPFVSRPGAPVVTPRRFQLTHGRPGLDAV